MKIEPETIVIGSREYRVGKLSLSDALHVARLIAPLAPSLFGEVLGHVAKLIEASKDENQVSPDEYVDEIKNLFLASEPTLYRLSMMARNDFESVVNTCLSCVEVKHDRGFGRLVVDGALMYDDLDIVSALKLVMHVLAREIRPIIAVFFNSSEEKAA